MHFRTFLERSFAVLRDEVPDIYAHFGAALAGSDVRIRVDDDVTLLQFRGARIDFDERSAGPSTVDVVTSRGAILELLEARSTLLEAVVADRLFLRGATEDLLAFYDALMTFLHGAFRAPAFPKLLTTFRTDAARRSARRRRHG
jgi:hypothetical protein